MIFAVGSLPNFSYHQNKGQGKLKFVSVDVATCICNKGEKGYIGDYEFNKGC